MSDFPAVAPTLNLDFANSKQLDPRITFRRASTGTYVDSDGLIKTAGINVPRFDHDPITGVCKGLLVEESRTNLVTYSEDISNAVWTKSNLTVSKEVLAGPNGVVAYDKLTLGTFNASSASIAYYLGTVSGSATRSVYLKAGTCRFAALSAQKSDSSIVWLTFDLVENYVVYSTGGVTGSTVTPVGNGWCRISITCDDTGAGASARFFIYPMTEPDGATISYNANNQYMYAYGAQTELGSFPTSYIPTTASTVTRSADSAIITGTNFSSWYNFSSGTLLLDAIATQANTGVFTAVQKTTLDPRVFQLGIGSGSTMEAYGGGYGQNYSIKYTGFSPTGSRIKAINAAETNNVRFTVNGLPVSQDTSFIMPPSTDVDRLNIGFLNGVSAPLGSATISRIAYWPKRLPDAQLQALTRR